MVKVIKCIFNAHNQIVATLSNSKGFVAQVVYDAKSKETHFAFREVLSSIGYTDNAPLTSLIADVPANEKHMLPVGGSNGNQKKLCTTLDGLNTFLNTRSGKTKYAACDYREWIRRDVVPMLQQSLTPKIAKAFNSNGVNVMKLLNAFFECQEKINELNTQVQDYKECIGMYQSMIDA